MIFERDLRALPERQEDLVLARKLLIALRQLATTGTLLRAFASTRRSNPRGTHNATTRRAGIDRRVAPPMHPTPFPRGAEHTRDGMTQAVVRVRGTSLTPLRPR